MALSSFRKNFVQLQNRFFSVFAFAVFVMFFFMTVWGENGVVRLIELKRIGERIEAENAEILKQNLLMVQEIDKLKDVNYVGQQARSRLGMVRPDETVFVVPEVAAKNAKN